MYAQFPDLDITWTPTKCVFDKVLTWLNFNNIKTRKKPVQAPFKRQLQCIRNFPLYHTILYNSARGIHLVYQTYNIWLPKPLLLSLCLLPFAGIDLVWRFSTVQFGLVSIWFGYVGYGGFWHLLVFCSGYRFVRPVVPFIALVRSFVRSH